jgi:TetR/AcrR family transcriptional regulator, regulator of mycofactocin system
VSDVETLTTRRRLQDAALDLFDRVGFDDATIDDIAEAAGTSRRTFFRYFATKEDAAVADFAGRIELLDRLLSEERRADQSAIDQVIEAGRTIFGSFMAEPDFYLKRYRIVFANPALIDRMTVSDRRYEDLIVRSVREEFPGELGGLHARMFASAALALTNVLVERWISDPDSDLEPFAAKGIADLRRASAAWQEPSLQSATVIILGDSQLSADEIRFRLTGDRGPRR